MEPVLHSKKSHRNDKLVRCNKKGAPPAATREKPAQQRRPGTAKTQERTPDLKIRSESHFPQLEISNALHWTRLVSIKTATFSRQQKAERGKNHGKGKMKHSSV